MISNLNNNIDLRKSVKAATKAKNNIEIYIRAKTNSKQRRAVLAVAVTLVCLIILSKFFIGGNSNENEVNQPQKTDESNVSNNINNNDKYSSHSEALNMKRSNDMGKKSMQDAQYAEEEEKRQQKLQDEVNNFFGVGETLNNKDAKNQPLNDEFKAISNNNKIIKYNNPMDIVDQENMKIMPIINPHNETYVEYDPVTKRMFPLFRKKPKSGLTPAYIQYKQNQIDRLRAGHNLRINFLSNDNETKRKGIWQPPNPSRERKNKQRKLSSIKTSTSSTTTDGNDDAKTKNKQKEEMKLGSTNTKKHMLRRK